MSDITFGMVQMAMGRGVDMESAEDRAEFWRMWVTLERELEAQRQDAQRREQFAQMPDPTPHAPNAPNLGAVLGALAGVMAASQAQPKGNDAEDDGA